MNFLAFSFLLSIQEEREERHKFKKQHGIVDDPSRRTRFDPTDLPGGRFASGPLGIFSLIFEIILWKYAIIQNDN